MVAGCDMPACATNFDCETCPAYQFSAGGSVSFVTAFSSGLAGHQSLSQGVGSSIWLGCTTQSGLEIRACFSVFGSQQFIDQRR